MDSYEPCFHLWVLYSPSNLVLAHTFFFYLHRIKIQREAKIWEKVKHKTSSTGLYFSLQFNA